MHRAVETIRDNCANDLFFVTMQVARDIPYSALQFMTFEYLKKRSAPYQNLDKDKRFTKRLVHDLCIGAVCILTVSLPPFPVQVI